MSRSTSDRSFLDSNILLHAEDRGAPEEHVLAAIDLHRLHGLSFRDGLIVRAAQVCRCAVLFSEDLQHGRRFDNVEVVNPFR